ncbi:MAG: NPXTG-anchored protein [Ruminococcus sp.]|nr:NPXTG-anchored protein [Ruminococcus sp.]
MKITKILAGMSAAAVAASMLAVSAVSAEEQKEEAAEAKTYPITSYKINVDVVGEDALFTAQYTSWAGVNATLSAGENQTIDLSPAAEETGFTNLGYVQSAEDSEEPLPEGSSVTVNYIEVNDIKFEMGDILTGEEDEDGNAANGLLNEWWGENGYDIVSADGAYVIKFDKSGLTLQDFQAEEYEFEYPFDASFAAGGKSWGGVEFDVLKEVEFNAWDGIWWQLDIPTPEVAEGEEPNFVVNTEDAKAVIEIKFVEDVPEGQEIVRYFDTNDGTKYHAVADRNYVAGEGITVEIPWADIQAAIVDDLGNDDKFWGNGFGGNFQVGVPAIVSSFVTGYSIEDAPVDESSEVVEESSSDVVEESSTAPTDSKKADSSSKAASAATTTNPGTGAAALAVVGVALAGAAVVTTKKRK